MIGLQIRSTQIFKKIRNSMLQLKARHFVTDYQVLLCAEFAFDIRFDRVNIVTADTDLAILGMYFQSMLNMKIYFQYRSLSAMILYDLSENSLNWNLVQALPSLDAFSGCNKIRTKLKA